MYDHMYRQAKAAAQADRGLASSLLLRSRRRLMNVRELELYQRKAERIERNTSTKRHSKPMPMTTSRKTEPATAVRCACAWPQAYVLPGTEESLLLDMGCMDGRMAGSDALSMPIVSWLVKS